MSNRKIFTIVFVGLLLGVLNAYYAAYGTAWREAKRDLMAYLGEPEELEVIIPTAVVGNCQVVDTPMVFSRRGGMGGFNVSGCRNWKPWKEAPWIAISDFNEEKVDFEVKPNDGEAREALIIVGGDEVRVVQKAATPGI